jgi:hypothetical protein
VFHFRLSANGFGNATTSWRRSSRGWAHRLQRCRARSPICKPTT